MFKKILIANRGEIAVRIIHTAQKLGIYTVAVYAEDDSGSLHVSMAEEAFLLPGTLLSETYLNQDKIIKIALECGAEAIHPGYGFLSENAGFAGKVEDAGLIFIGASADQIRLMGKKTKAVGFAKSLGIPVIPGIQKIFQTQSEDFPVPRIQDKVNEILSNHDFPGFPVLLKPSAGGGGKGMQIVQQPEDLPLALRRAQRQAKEYFGDSEIFIEKYLPSARHIEVQIMGDGKGNVVHLFERECSVQRRYQKLIEESPAVAVSFSLKEKLYAYALLIARAARYRGAGTVEFLVDGNEGLYFLEMNTRLQVEHPVTECITGQDLVEWQIRIAAGMGLPLRQNEILLHGHAIEARICAEDPANGFLPSQGNVTAVEIPETARWDGFISANHRLSPSYDSLLGKLIVHGVSREKAIEKMHLSLERLLIGGVKINQLFLLQVMQSQTFRTNKVTTCFLDEQIVVADSNNICEDDNLLNLSGINRKQVHVDVLLAAYLLHNFYRPVQKKNLWSDIGFWRMHAAFQVDVEGKKYDLTVITRNGKFCLRYGGAIENKPGGVHAGFSEFYDVLFEKNKIIVKQDCNLYEVMAFNIQDITIVQYKGHQFILRSQRVAGQATSPFSHFNRNGDVEKVALPGVRNDDIEHKGRGKSGEALLKITSGLFGKVVDILTRPGERLTKGQNLLIIESMKTEFTIQCPTDATVKAVHISKGKMIHDKEILMDLHIVKPEKLKKHYE